MRSVAALLVLAAAVFGGCDSSTSTSDGGGAEDELLTRQDLAADWKNGVSSKGRWYARFASADQIAFGCDVSDAKARRYHRRLKGTFPESLLAELEADCEAQSPGRAAVGEPREHARPGRRGRTLVPAPKLVGLELSAAQVRLRRLAGRYDTIEGVAPVRFDVDVEVVGALPAGESGTRMVVSGYTVDDLPAAETIGRAARVRLFAVPAATYRDDDGFEQRPSPQIS